MAKTLIGLRALGLLLLLLLVGSEGALAQSIPAQVSVIELFTSQGCSSCPPADRLLGEFSKQPGVIAMSFPVTYWDYLGWKDTLAKPEYTKRQWAYAAKNGDGNVYTPQAVVNGIASCIGSDPDKINSALAATSAVIAKSAVTLNVKRDGKLFVIEAGPAPAQSQVRKGKLWMASILSAAEVAIASGENAGKRVTYVNVVRNLAEIGPWEGAATAYSVPVEVKAVEATDRRVVFLQADGPGPIVAAARLEK